MQGYLLTFMMHERSRHRSTPTAEWLAREAASLGIEGITVNMPEGGMGRDRIYHSVNNSEIGEQVIEVILAVSPAMGEKLFEKLREEKLNIFYTKASIEFGFTTESTPVF